MKKFNALILVFLLIISFKSFSQDLISGGSNSWIFHTPDNGATSLHIAPMINGTWDWQKQTTFLGNGNVKFLNKIGIGGIDPNARLEVFEEARVRLSSYLPKKNVATIINLGVSGATGAENWTIRGVYQYANGVNYNSEGGDLDLIKSWNGNTILATKKDNTPLGKIGIGTANPDEILTVKGKIHAEEVRIDLSVPADYVFQKYYTGKSLLKEEYSMPTLAEVEAFTKKYHHLPEVPSAKEIQQKGLQVKEMTNLLLQKIEELTLYTIEQEKRIKKLEEKLAQKE